MHCMSDGYLVEDLVREYKNAGKITAEIAKSKAETKFEKYRGIQDRLFMSGYDRYLLELEKNTESGVAGGMYTCADNVVEMSTLQGVGYALTVKKRYAMILK